MFGKQCSFIVTECSSEEALALENLCLHFLTAQFQEDSFTLDLQVTGDAPTTSASPCTCRATGQVTIVTGPFTSSVSPPWFPQPISCYNPPSFLSTQRMPVEFWFWNDFNVDSRKSRYNKKREPQGLACWEVQKLSLQMPHVWSRMACDLCRTVTNAV